MNTISLNDNDTRSIPTGGYLRIDAHSVGNRSEKIKIAVNGVNLKVNEAGPSSAFLMACPQNATIVVSPLEATEFGPDQSVRVVISRGGSSDGRDYRIEFPIVRVDGVSEKIVGEIKNTGTTFDITAYGSNVSTDLGREAMVILSSLRTRLTGPTGITSLVVHNDASATSARVSDARVLQGLGNLIIGVGTALGLDQVRCGDSAVPFDRITDHLHKGIEDAATRVGNAGVPTVGDDTLLVHLTPAPGAAMVSETHPSLVVIYGPTAAAEQELFSLNITDTGKTGSIVVDDHFLTSLETGNVSGVAPHTAVISQILLPEDSQIGVTP